MTDKIRVQDLTFQACHGALPHERTIAQEFRVDIALELPLQKAGASDRLKDTVNYAEVTDLVASIMDGPSHNLLESLAEEIAQQILTRYAVPAVRVTVRKMAPPLKMPSGPVQVEIERRG